METSNPESSLVDYMLARAEGRYANVAVGGLAKAVENRQTSPVVDMTVNEESLRPLYPPDECWPAGETIS